MKNIFTIKIILTIILALIITRLSSERVFYSNTPYINKTYIVKVIQLPLDVLKNSRELIVAVIINKRNNVIKNQKSVSQNSKKIYPQNNNNIPINVTNQVSKGIYAKEDESDNTIYIHITKEMEFEEQILYYNGKQTKLRFPKGTFK